MWVEEEKQAFRSVVRKIHPDRFMQYPEESNVNNTSLAALNAFLEAYVQGKAVVRSTRLQFFTLEKKKLQKIEVELCGRESLYDLFDAFGVECERRSRSWGESDGLDLLKYMQEHVSEALALSERFSSLSTAATTLNEELRETYCFEDIRFQDVVRTSCSNAVWQLSALKLLSSALERLDSEVLQSIANQRIVLHRERTFREGNAVQGRDVHLVVNRTLKSQLRKIDRHLLGTLSKLDQYWFKRAEQLLPNVVSLLQVRSVMGDFVYSGDGRGNTMSAEDAVLWCGKMLRSRDAFDLAFENVVDFNFTILVHSDFDSPYVDIPASMATSTMISVRSDCPPGVLLAWLCSEEARSFSDKIKLIENHKILEMKHLAKVKKSLKARQVIRVCSPPEGMGPFFDGCERLVANSKYIMEQVDLKGVFLAIDDCYEVWESGFVSIPYDFELEDFCQKLSALPAPSQNEARGKKKSAPTLLDAGAPALSRVTHKQRQNRPANSIHQRPRPAGLCSLHRCRPMRRVMNTPLLKRHLLNILQS